MKFAAFVFLSSVSALACGGGGGDEPVPTFAVAVEAMSDPGKLLAGVEIKSADKVLGTTDPKGRTPLTLRGPEGGTVELTVRCPAEYESPSEPLAITLRRFVGPSPAPLYSVKCPPKVRSVVAVVRAENGANLPIFRLGREVGRTSAEGIAHMLLDVKPGESVELVLNTSDKESERLRPQNPSVAFVAKGHDDYVLLDQKFAIEAPKARAAAPRARRPSRI
jgi:hypothetical protein